MLGGDIVHHDDVAPMRPGCDNDFVLVNSLFFLFALLSSSLESSCGSVYLISI